MGTTYLYNTCMLSPRYFLRLPVCAFNFMFLYWSSPNLFIKKQTSKDSPVVGKQLAGGRPGKPGMPGAPGLPGRPFRPGGPGGPLSPGMQHSATFQLLPSIGSSKSDCEMIDCICRLNHLAVAMGLGRCLTAAAKARLSLVLSAVARLRVEVDLGVHAANLSHHVSGGILGKRRKLIRICTNQKRSLKDLQAFLGEST